ncbi:hypothetical protein CSTERTH_06110 [Thermoclostridium stercorarium subsp. thermolacticum DSM 2910]|uniref:Uncharacterized protein n=2 Tax=Thermoclostridium stercorarium TaxID=1510 RepID=A0A1B1YK67_THEST|nr:hypothetical protein Clst_1245 [Thermoclostridium stercorarium subsp. stercorarium DSM 8532]ANW98638.1 hypothetical protein CSTERTH_06110 [Thermoclostridium stercorarium subsp. thermolacticum DSM 2910]ANX01179.1 hypothetical protein CSTERLE_06120 [Thermoclostridium stercorarium subsp. leptospartum DSM 9219]
MVWVRVVKYKLNKKLPYVYKFEESKKLKECKDKLTLEDLKKIASRKDLPLRPVEVHVPESVKKYDRIHISIERAKKLLNLI